MKHIKTLTVLFILSIITVSCTDTMTTPGNIDLTENITGKYEGNLDEINNPNKDYPAEVLIERISGNSIQMTLHCEIMDTTIDFDLYENMDSLMVCFSGDDFENHYGHGMRGKHHMMDDDERYDWMHHLDEDHEPGDMHYGRFNMDMHSFRYEFVNDNNEIKYVFNGVKSE